MQATEKSSTASIILRVLFSLGLLATVIFIFSNSSQIGAVSGLRSAEATALINGVLSRLGLGLQLSELTVRKLAHFAEFALLGFMMMLTLRVYTRRVVAFIAWPLFFGLATAVGDEFLQNFIPGRISAVTDVLIDFVGVLGGMFFGLVALLFFSAIASAFSGGRDRRGDPEDD